MIPKIIHYCWFGGKPKDKLSQKCIESWKKYCPDFEIKEWNESNYDVTKNQYMYEAYQAKKWGFVPDFARLDIIYNEGGIYLDTDVEILRPIDELLNNTFYIGLEEPNKVNLGLGFGAEKDNSVIKELMEQYENMKFVKEDGSLDLTPSPIIQTLYFTSKGLKGVKDVQKINGVAIYSMEYFCPINPETGICKITENTISIHHFNATWKNPIHRAASNVFKKCCQIFGEKRMMKIKKMLKKEYRC